MSKSLSRFVVQKTKIQGRIKPLKNVNIRHVLLATTLGAESNKKKH